MIAKHSLLSLWSGLEGIKRTHRITKEASASSFQEGQWSEGGGESEHFVGDDVYFKPWAWLQLPVPRRSWFGKE